MSQRCAHTTLTREVPFERCSAYVRPYLMFKVTHQQRLEGLQLRLLRIFPDLHVSPFPSKKISTVFSLKLQQHASMLGVGTTRHIASFFFFFFSQGAIYLFGPLKR